MLLTSSLAVLSAEFSGAERAQAFAFWGASLGTALAIGPVLGGAITDSVGWRWIFLINIPICLLLIRVVATAVPVLGNAVPPSRAGMASGLASTTRFIGILVSVAALGAILAAVVSRIFLLDTQAMGFPRELATAVVKKVTAGNVQQAIEVAPQGARAQLLVVAHQAFGRGFAVAIAVAAVLAAVAAVATFQLVRDVSAGAADAARLALPCKAVDCRHPL